MMILSYIHRQELKTYVTSVVWPEMDKPIIHFPPPSSRDDNHFESEECDKLLPGEEVTVDQIEHLVARKKIEENNDQFDSGVSGSEYSGSGKSLPIYRLGYRLDFRRGNLQHFSLQVSNFSQEVMHHLEFRLAATQLKQHTQTSTLLHPQIIAEIRCWQSQSDWTRNLVYRPSSPKLLLLHSMIWDWHPFNHKLLVV